MYIEVKMKRHEFTFPAPEQLEHRSVLGGESGWSPLFNVESGSIRTSDPVLEQRAQARYPVKKNKFHKHERCTAQHLHPKSEEDLHQINVDTKAFRLSKIRKTSLQMSMCIKFIVGTKNYLTAFLPHIFLEVSFPFLSTGKIMLRVHL